MTRPRDEDSPPLGHDQGGALYTDEEREVLAAVARYKQERHKPSLTVTEFLHCLRDMGYRRIPKG